MDTLHQPRYERKCVATGSSLPEVLAIVRRHPAAFREAYPPRLVNNVYLDTLELDDYREHVNGLADRVKTRVRWYGSQRGQIGGAAVERKIRRGLVSGKSVHPLSGLAVNGDPAGGVRAGLAKAENLPASLRCRLRCLEPSLFNRYHRCYFVSADGRFRLTVDSELQFAAARSGSAAESPPLPHVILELKFSPQHDGASASITNFLPFRIARCSKYVLGIRLTSFM